ncbi:hypothetical protein [Streptomyces sp. TN58]|uniref:hypothetical protein n=1 Tax=Streptomyces sp. TN58 TaxID=234612 RepID=UPI0009506EBA|nr:hypothetical protein [Streptomyces sp. TN58]APU40148.1 hypothetical protein BSL84_10610 [Streptomyces sp. TN58]
MSMLTLKGPRWVTVRQHRRALWTLSAAVSASLAAVTALRWWASYAADPYEVGAGWALREGMGHAGTAMLLLPLLVGAFTAGPVVARELESGTYRLALTQSTTPRAWLASKAVLAAAAATAGSAALVGVYRLGHAPLADSHQFTWADRGPYESTGTVVVAYCLLGVAVGTLVGQLVRRTLPAMAVTGLVTGVVMLVLSSLRWSILPIRTLTAPVAAGPPKLSTGDFMTDLGLTTGSGGRLSEGACFERTRSMSQCPADLDVTGWYLEYHPVSHYWPTQSVETAVVLVLAALSLWGAFAVLRKRHP